SRAISSSVSVNSPACTEEVSVDSLSMGGVSFPPPASGVFVCWAHAEGYAALFHPIKSRDPQLLRIPPLKVYPGAPHGLTVTHKDQLNADLLNFFQQEERGRLAA